MIKEFLESHGEYSSDKYFKDLTTIKMGGHIKHYVLPNSIDDLIAIVDYVKEKCINFKVIGNGSNLICGEAEYDGVVICPKKLNSYEINGDEVYVEAGVKGPFLANVVSKEGLSGLEFASSIPGDVGGLLYMNAGAYKEAMSDVVKEVLVYKKGEKVWLSNKEMEYGYRKSILQEHPHWVVLAARLKLTKKDPSEIIDLMEDRLKRRQNSQPLDKPSAGSCFRNPDGDFAWKYIDGIGYRGHTENGIEVSSKHSNFIINNGGGTANDYLKIVLDIQKKVYDKYNLKLIMEAEKFNC